jgi:putative ABC transport system permease protein
MSALSQITSISAMNMRAVPQRLGTSFVIVIGIAGVVAVMLAMLAMSTGLLKTMAGAGRDDRAIVVRAGSAQELASALSRAQGNTIMDAPGVKRNAAGKPIASAETITVMDLPTRDKSWANVTVRGVGPLAFELRPELRIVEGRMFKPAVNELIIGSKTLLEFPTLGLGKTVKFAQNDWQIVGIFEGAGSRHESEVFGDAETVMSAVRRNGYQPVTVMLDSPEDSFDQFKKALTTDPTLAVDVRRESDYLKEQSGTLSRVISVIAYVVGGIMAVGALFGALNTMYSAVSARSREIATLRALGFGATPVVISVFVEALLLALLGGALGALAAWLFFDGNIVSTSGGNVAQIVFALAFTPGLVAIGVIWACAIGLIGGLFPAVRAARLPVATALRAT